MAVGAKEREILNAVVAPITIDVLDFHGNLPGLRMTFVPTAAAAFFAEEKSKILTDVSVAVVDTAVRAALKKFSSPFEFVSAMAGLGAK